jgi:Mg2+ and Co2+ transporter CorA
MEQLAAVATERLSVEELRTSMDKLRLNTRNLASILTDAMQNNDFLMLRSIVDRQYDIDRAINRAKQFTRDGKGSIDEVSAVIEKVALNAVNERNRKLALDSIESVDEFIKRQEEIVTRTDRTGKPVVERQTISESQYKSKYGTDQNLLDLIKGNLITLAGETTEAARLAS